MISKVAGLVMACVICTITVTKAQESEISFPLTPYDFAKEPRTQLSPMSIKLFDDYHTRRPSVGTPPGGGNYGTLLAIYGRATHWQHDLYFSSSKKMYFRTGIYTSWTAEDGTKGGFSDWRMVLDNKSTVKTTGNLEVSGSGPHFIANGYLGVGTQNPNAALTVNGTISLNATSKYGGEYPTDNNNYNNVLTIGGKGAEKGLKIFKQNSGDSPTIIGPTYYNDTYIFEMTDYNGNNPDGGIVFGGTGKDDVFEPILTIRGNGRVGVGTVHPQYDFAVKGVIGCGEIKVEDVTSWPDYVFAPDYNLMSLGKLEQFIVQNGHLPGIPSQEQVMQEGYSVGAMQSKLLEKIEELTLHVIALEKENKKLAAQNKMLLELKKEVEAIKATLSE